jgi:hypothetical protein
MAEKWMAEKWGGERLRRLSNRVREAIAVGSAPVIGRIKLTTDVTPV